MNTNAIERIKGFACEVTQEQWNKLVKVADEVGVKVDRTSRRDGVDGGKYPIAGLSVYDHDIYTRAYFKSWKKIPFPSFLAKLKGEEQSDPFTASETREMARKKWEPKCGEMVEVEVGKLKPTWSKAEMVCVHKGYYICNEVNNWQYMPFKLNQIRPITPTITRAEAEAQLRKRIID